MRPDEFLFPVSELRESTQEEIDECMDLDPEVVLITDYLIKNLDADGVAEVERRLREDDGFRERVQPIIMAWNAWPSASDFEVSEEELAASWQRLQRNADRHIGTTPDPTGEQQHQQQGSTWNWESHPRTRSLIRQLRRTQLALAVLFLVALLAAAFVGVSWWPQVKAPRLHSSDAAADPGRPIPVGTNAWVTLGTGARLTWSDAATPNGVRELYLEGSAHLELPALESGQYMVITPSGYIRVLGAKFRIESPNPSVTVVEVTEGRVVAQSRGGGPFEVLDVGPGDSAQLTWAQAPRRAR